MTSPSSNAREKWWPETRRVLVSTLVSVVGTAVSVTSWVLFVPADASLAVPLGTVVAWTLLVACHAALTGWAFGGLAGADLDQALTAANPRRDPERLWPSWSVQVSLLALVVVAALVIVPEWRGHAVMMASALLMVSASWADMVLSFAVHYAAIDGGRIVFPDDDERGFGDYVYASIAVQATGAVSDFAVRTRSMRRQVALHKVLAFVFNTVIVAVAIAFLLGN